MLELVVAMAIAGMTGVLTAHFLWPHFNAYQRFSGKTDGKYLCDSLFHIMELKMRFGKDFEAMDNGTLRYVVVEEDGGETEKLCPASYDADTVSFIQEDYLIRMSYKTDSTRGWVRITMYVYDESKETAELLYEGTASIRSLYSKVN